MAEKLLEILVEKALPMFVEYLITELIKESIDQAKKSQEIKALKHSKRVG